MYVLRISCLSNQIIVLSIRSNTNNPLPINKKNNAFTKKEDRERKSEGSLLKAVQHCKHGFKAPASQQVNHHKEQLADSWSV